jgi:isopenicillin-N N-acyltransferase like protein
VQQFLATVVVLFFAGSSFGQAPTTFPPAKHGNGELVHISGFPVLTLRGSPEEMGEQFGVLAIKNAPGITELQQQFLKDVRLEDKFDGIKLLARTLKKNFPKDHLTEMEKAAKTAGRELDLIYFANTIYDLSSGMGCSTLVVEPTRSSTDGPLFGRNFDWMNSKGIDQHTLLVVFQPKGKRAFAMISISPILGCISGMNEDGLAVTVNEVRLRQSKDKAEFNWKGTPMLALFRRVLEECKTVKEAEELLRKSERTTAACLTLCDGNGGAVFELTPKSIEVRSAVNSVCCCTNHFHSETLGIGQTCKRFSKLAPLQKADNKLSIADVFEQLDSVNQGNKTLQSRTLHLKCGDTITSASKMKPMTFELAKLFAKR